MPEGKKSIGVAVTLQPRDKTLTDAEIEARGAEDRRRGGEEDRSDAARMKLLREIAVSLVARALLAGADAGAQAAPKNIDDCEKIKEPDGL